MSGNHIALETIDAVRLTRNIVATMDMLSALAVMGKEFTTEYASGLFDRFRLYCDADMIEAIDRLTANVTPFPWSNEPEIEAGYNHAVATHRFAVAHAAQYEPIISRKLAPNQLF